MKTACRIFGIAVFGVCLFQVFYLVRSNSDEFVAGFSLFGMGLVAFLAGITIFANLLLAYNWLVLVRLLSPNVRPKFAILVYCSSIIGKYFPSGVFQFFGRHLYASDLNVPHKTIAKASVGELLSIVVLATIVVGALFPYLPAVMTGSLALFALLLVLFLWVKIFSFNRRAFELLKCVTIINLYLLIMTCCNIGVLAEAGVVEVSKLFSGFWAFHFTSSFAFVTGLVSIGVPGGIGVREIVFLATIEESLISGEAAALGALTFLRMTQVLGDVVLSLAAFCVMRFGASRG